MDNLKFYNVHMLVLLNDCKHIAKNRQYYIYTGSLYKD